MKTKQTNALNQTVKKSGNISPESRILEAIELVKNELEIIQQSKDLTMHRYLVITKVELIKTSLARLENEVKDLTSF